MNNLTDDMERLKKTAKPSGNSSRIYVPKDWEGDEILAINLDSGSKGGENMKPEIKKVKFHFDVGVGDLQDINLLFEENKTRERKKGEEKQKKEEIILENDAKIEYRIIDNPEDFPHESVKDSDVVYELTYNDKDDEIPVEAVPINGFDFEDMEEKRRIIEIAKECIKEYERREEKEDFKQTWKPVYSIL